MRAFRFLLSALCSRCVCAIYNCALRACASCNRRHRQNNTSNGGLFNSNRCRHTRAHKNALHFTARRVYTAYAIRAAAYSLSLRPRAAAINNAVCERYDEWSALCATDERFVCND